ncbi:hypothetical protein [Nocardia wallacei]|uniref:hypothetical protein n=1 Tax=Nocardia wallacei TaxID=480035 RepID=UPI0024555809|nr:hypothetical protein [Nocardia wallacei]
MSSGWAHEYDLLAASVRNIERQRTEAQSRYWMLVDWMQSKGIALDETGMREAWIEETARHIFRDRQRDSLESFRREVLRFIHAHEDLRTGGADVSDAAVTSLTRIEGAHTRYTKRLPEMAAARIEAEKMAARIPESIDREQVS